MPYGHRGNSIVRFFEESYDNLVLVAGLSKSYSSLAAFLALPTWMKNYLKVAAPPYLYSGPSPTASLATTLAGLDVNDAEGDEIPQIALPEDRSCAGPDTQPGAADAEHLGLSRDRGPPRQRR